MNRTAPWPVGTRVVLTWSNSHPHWIGATGTTVPGDRIPGSRIRVHGSGECCFSRFWHQRVAWDHGEITGVPVPYLRPIEDPDQTETEDESEELTA